MSHDHPAPVIAVLGADGLLGEAMLAALAADGLPAAQLIALGGEDVEGERLAYGDAGLRVQPAAGCDWSRIALVIATDDAALAAAQLPLARRAGARVLDASGWLAGEAPAPVAIAGHDDNRWRRADALVLPDAVTLALARVLMPLAALAGIGHVGLTVLRAASDDGRAAVEELAQQTIALLNARPSNPQIYPRRLAFNVLPEWQDLDAQGRGGGERRLDAGLEQVLGLAPGSVATTLLRVPLFYGLACVVHLRCTAALSPAAARERLLEVPGLEVLEADEAPVSPAEDGLGQPAVRVGGLRAAGERGLNLWVVADNVALPASNGVQIAQTLIGTAE